jgi:phytoene dehydrogenase-like protein
MATDFDAIVVGAGHNGLTAGTVLVKNGLSVLCVEKNTWPGGMAATKELFKGFKHNVGAWGMLVFRDEMLKRLELEKYGLKLNRPRSSYCTFGAPGDVPFIGYTDTTEMTEHLMKDHGPDALEGLAGLYMLLQKYKTEFDKDLYKEARPFDRLITEAPDDETRKIILKFFRASAIEILRQFFPDPKKHRIIQASLCASSVDGAYKGPWTPGTGLNLAYHYCLGDSFDFRTPKGGIGAFSEALVRAFEDRGGKIKYGAPVKRLLIEKGEAVGVQLKNGEKISAKVVLSNIDAYATFIGLVGEDQLPSDFVHAVKDIQYHNGYIQVHMTLKEMPEFTGHVAFANENNIRWIMAYIPSPEYLGRCWEQYRQGQVPDEPVAYCGFPSVLDPSLAPAGYHTCTLFSQYFPCDAPPGKLKELSRVMADRAIDQIAKYAPNFRAAIMDKVVFTQQYFESTYGATRGDYCNGLVHPEQMYDNRPVPGWGGYTTPIKNLYMCGSACHPGPGISCVPGWNGAHRVLKDLGK